MRRRITVALGLLIGGVLAGTTASSAHASGDGEVDADDRASVVVREPKIESVGIHFASRSDEERISEDIRAKISDRGDLLASCYALHAAEHPDPDGVITVDWTITTAGEPLDFTVFTGVDAIAPCIRRTLSDLRFEHLDDSHPRARVDLRFR